MKNLPQRVAEYVRSHALLGAGHRTAIAVSGGLDSVAMLRLALELRQELGLVLTVAHFNHRLRGEEAEADQRFVGELARHHGLEFHCRGGDVRGYAQQQHLSLEAAARRLRSEFFRDLLRTRVLDRIATAHTLDDQAETVILRLARGAGTRGLSGIYPRVEAEGGAIVRPLLQIRREDLEAYVRSRDQDWREDKSNHDLTHTRNRVRHHILPVLERDLNPSVREALAAAADIARDEELFWNGEVERVLPGVATAGGVLKIPALLNFPLALQRRLVRRVTELLGLSTELKHVSEVLLVARGDASSAELPNDWAATRAQGELRFQLKIPGLRDYEYPLPIPGTADVPEAQARFETMVSSGGAVSNPSDWLDSSLLKNTLTVRNWRAGDRFWPVHSRTAKKVKELLQERRITGSERQGWPVVACGGKIVWLRGFPVSQEFRAREGDQTTFTIRERPLEHI